MRGQNRPLIFGKPESKFLDLNHGRHDASIIGGAERASAAAPSVSRLPRKWNPNFVGGGKVDRARITGISVTEDAYAGVAGEDALEAPTRIVGAIGDDDHAGVLRVTDADAAAVVDGNPGGARGSVH